MTGALAAAARSKDRLNLEFKANGILGRQVISGQRRACDQQQEQIDTEGLQHARPGG